jgi:hypothetical protein
LHRNYHQRPGGQRGRKIIAPITLGWFSLKIKNY